MNRPGLGLLAALIAPAAVSIVAVAVAQAPVRDPTAARTGTAVIRGRAIAADTARPMREALVTVTPIEGGAPIMMRTDSEGRFEVGSLPAGRYRIHIRPGSSAETYLRATFPPPVDGRAAAIELSDGQVVEKLQISLARGGVVAGRVVDDHGEPVAGATVRILERVAGGERWANKAGQMPHTDDLGQFRVWGLAAGSYLVLAEPRNPGAATPSGEATRLLPTYYPGTTSAAAAAPVKVAGGQDVTGLELALTRGGTFRISGQVLNSRGEPAAQVSVMVMMRNPGGGSSGHGVSTAADGTFTARNVAAGDHFLTVAPSVAMRRESFAPGVEFASMPIAVYQDLEGLVITTRPGATVTGRIRFEPAMPLSVPPGLRIVTVAGDGLLLPGLPPTATVDGDGAFTLSHLFGPVLLRPAAGSGWWLNSVFLDRQDITDRPTEFRGGEASLMVVLTDKGAVLTGRVAGADGELAADAMIVLFGEEPSQWHARFSTTRTVAAKDGRFTIEGLRAGRYLVIALPGNEVSLTTAGTAEFDMMARLAAPIVLGDDEQRTIDLKLVKLTR